MVTLVFSILKPIVSFVAGILTALFAGSRSEKVLCAARDGIEATAQAGADRRAAKIRYLEGRVSRIEAASARLGSSPLRSDIAGVLSGLWWAAIAAGFTSGEYYLLAWTMAEIGEAGDSRLSQVLALVATAGLVMALEAFLHTIANLSERLAAFLEVIVAWCAAILIGVSVVSYAYLRGVLYYLNSSGQLGDLATIEAFWVENRAATTLPMVLLTAGVALASAYAVHKARILGPLVGWTVGLQLWLLRRRAAALEGRSALERKLAIATMKAFDAGFYIAEGLRVGAGAVLGSLVRRLQRPSERRIAVAVAVVVLALLVASMVKADPSEPRPGTIVVLIDLSESCGGEILQSNVAAVGALIDGMSPGDELLVLGIVADSFGHPAELLRGRLPSHQCRKLDPSCQRAKTTLRARWEDAATRLAADKPLTDIIGALWLVADDCQGKTCHVIFLSDMQHADGKLNLEKPIPPNTAARLQQERRIPLLDGVAIWMLGVHPNKKTPAERQALEEFWREVFSMAGATVKAFRLDRRSPWSS